MKKLAIALKELNVSDEDIIEIISNNTKSAIKNLFYGKNNYILNNNIKLFKYISIFENKQLIDNALLKAQYILDENKKYDIKTVIYTGKYYPTNLKNITNPPAILYYKGDNFKKIHKRALACVGTRIPTSLSVDASYYLISQWVREKFIIVSGLSSGVDTLCHKACLQNKGITIAVLAHGLDYIYPKQNEKLAQEILNNNGIIVSEYPIGTKAEKFRFIQRNRIIVGLSLGTIVFESKIKSGTMHSVKFSQEQNKLIFCPKPNESNIKIQQEGLKYLIDNNIAIPIPHIVNFEVPIFALGYKLKYSPIHLKKLKNNSLKTLLNTQNYNYFELLDLLSDKNNQINKNISINANNFELLKKISNENNLSIKELINASLQNIINIYSKDTI